MTSKSNIGKRMRAMLEQMGKSGKAKGWVWKLLVEAADALDPPPVDFTRILAFLEHEKAMEKDFLSYQAEMHQLMLKALPKRKPKRNRKGKGR